MAKLVIRQFDVCTARGRRSGQAVVVVQSHLLEGVDTLLVAPLLSIARPQPGGVVVSIMVDGEERQLVLSQLAAVPATALSPPAGSVLQNEDEIRRGLDRLFTGF